MSRRTAFFSAIAAVLVVLVGWTTPAVVRAHTNDRLVYLTFSGPVQVPGATLDAGTYRFRVVNPDSGLRVLQVLSHDGGVVHAMFSTIPDSRMNVTDEPTVTFKETAAGIPPVIKSLFYGGERSGYEFMYSGYEPATIPRTWPQPAITYTPNRTAAISEEATAPELVLSEARAEAAIAEPVVEPVAEPVAEPVTAPTAAELPKTASPVPLVALGGLTSLIVGLSVGLLRRHLS